ncbi:hypothetical protein Smp_126060 [Schistosoma mansoni]|uniref:hypothetical protein n=1 Tax=Schistosoma mansoni TaxID=6183 RepID=UPI0001A63F97|nr:hypothetical protein Smp_126060 [Schistosoma mansoni]|eukprot:XP_018648463.1 hypothetical protein Smp_126060 [Schistosoma mansoni]
MDVEKNTNSIVNHSLYCCNLNKQRQTIQMNDCIPKLNDIDHNEQLTMKDKIIKRHSYE